MIQSFDSIASKATKCMYVIDDPIDIPNGDKYEEAFHLVMQVTTLAVFMLNMFFTRHIRLVQ